MIIEGHVNLDDADGNLREAFDRYLKYNGIIDMLFKCFLMGVSYGKKS